MVKANNFSKLNLASFRSYARRVIMGPGEKGAHSEQNYVWQMGSSTLKCSGSEPMDLMPRLWDILGVLRNIFPAPWEIPRQGYGAQLEDRYGLYLKKRPLSKAERFEFEKAFI